MMNKLFTMMIKAMVKCNKLSSIIYLQILLIKSTTIFISQAISFKNIGQYIDLKN